MNDAKTQVPIVDPDELIAIREQIAALIDEYGQLRRQWLSEHNWIVTPVWGDYEDNPQLAEKVASVAKHFLQEWFIASVPVGPRTFDAPRKKASPVCYKAPVSDRGFLDAAWEWLPSLEHVITTEDIRFAIVNPIETWYLIAGPRWVVERLLACTLEQAWANFGTTDAPFFDVELEGIRSQLRLYEDFFGTGSTKTIGGKLL